MNKNSNRGAALLSVIIVMTVVAILATLVLSVSYTNFKMKKVNRNAKDNFYSAEMVLDEICVGIQEEASIQYENAYVSVMENYGVYKQVADMENDFRTDFVLGMVEKYKVGANREQYDVDLLEDYVTITNYPAGATATVVAANNLNELDTLEDGLCFRNVSITYQDGNYVNTITTDIKVTIPQVTFSMIASIPEIANYSTIADDGITVSGASYWDIDGKAFAGLEEREDDEPKDEISIDLRPGAVLNTAFDNTTSLVSEGDINLVGASKFYTGKTTSLWTDGIVASPNATATDANNVLSLLGRTYVKDDTTIDGKGNKLTLGGQYYGYSNDDSDASGSSAIIINGQATTLDVSKLDTLVLAGTSFVGTSGEKLTDDVETTSDVLMGDSIAIKSNQLAYMLPTECEGIISNPMTYEQWNALQAVENWETKALSTKLPSLNQRTLASYGNVSIEPVFTAKSGGAVYLFIGFNDANLASQYFMDYYASSAGQQIEGYVNDYLTAIQFRAGSTSSDLGMSRLVTQGNYIVPAAYSNGTWTATYAGNTGNASSTAQELINYRASFGALCKKLITNASAITPDEENGTVYTNLISNTAIRSFLNALNSAGVQVEDVDYDSSLKMATISVDSVSNPTEKVEVIVIDNDGESTHTVPTGFKGIVIATGNVEVKNDVTGLIICDGMLTMSGGSDSAHKSLKADADIVGKAMQMTCTVGDKEYSVLNFFVGGGNLSLDSGNENEEGTDVRNLISFENWKSE